MGISSGRVIDRTGLKRLPVGIEDFARVVSDFSYVDKTLLARDLIDSNFNAVLFCRPRRFGKSLAMRMLQCYFEAPVQQAGIPERSALFEGTAICEAGERYLSEHGAHPVIYLTLSECVRPTWPETRAALVGAIAREFERHRYVLGDPEWDNVSDTLSHEKGGGIGPSDRAVFERISAKEPAAGELESSLAFLSDVLARHHGAGTVILIDEYDAPITQGHLRGFREEATDFCRSWLTGALKATTSLYLGVMTGVQRVSRESIFSGLNNLVVDTALNHRFSEAFGFTEPEAQALATFCGMADKLDEMRDWYDGYVFGGERVYNPWSLLNYLSEGGVAQPYWANTSSNSVVHDLFEQVEGATADDLVALAAGNTVSRPIDLATVFDMIGRDPLAIWSQLYLAGYLTTEDTDEPNDPWLERRLRVPNREVGLLYRHELADRSVFYAGDRARLRDVHKALVASDAAALEAALRRVLLDSPSAFDLVRENSYHMLLVGLLYYVYGYRFPASNREAGDGRADVVLAPERKNEGKLPGIVIEVKWGCNLDDAELSALAGEALAQVRSRSYADALPAGPRLVWGVAFSGKQVACRCESV